MARTRSPIPRMARIAGLVLMLGGALFVLLYEPEPAPLPPPPNERPAKLLKVETHAQTLSRSYSGTVAPSEEVDLAFRVSGPLIDLPIDRGQKIEAGDLIAQVDPRDFRTRLDNVSARLDEARARLKAMTMGEREEILLRLQNQLTAAKANAANAEIELQRRQQLLDENVISKSEYDQAKLRYDTATEKAKAAEQELAQGQRGARTEDVEAQEATIRGLEAQQRTAQNALADTTMRAPFGGRIAMQHVENFQEVRAGETIVSLQQVATVKIVADVPESVVAGMRKELIEKLTATFESLPGRVFDVEFREMETMADPRTQTFSVAVQMEAPEGVNLLPGMPATLQLHVRLDAGDAATGYPVPASAIFADASGTPQVWKVDPESQEVSLHAVTVGNMAGTQILVTSGLTAGETIVTAGVHSLRPGMKVWEFQLPGAE